MIVDIHSHAWLDPDHFSADFRAQSQRARAGVKVDLSVSYEQYRATAPAETRTVVFGGKANRSGIWVDDRFVADYVAADPGRLIGFLSVDPTRRGWKRELRHGHQDLGLVGVKLLPMYAGFRPDDRCLDWFWRYVDEHRLPVLLHTGTTFVSQAPIACTLPRHLDRVAIQYPNVRMILAHLGHPYESECIAVIRKHPNLYADISALHYRPFQFFHSLMLVQEYGVWDKLLFGTDFPFTTVNATMDGLKRLNQMVAGTNLPKLDESAIEAMIHRNSLQLLGLESSVSA